jgi:hypothetical protein
MRADYATSANAISIAIVETQTAEHSDEVHPRAIVALSAGRRVEVQLLYPDMGSQSRSRQWPIATTSTAKRSRQRPSRRSPPPTAASPRSK